MSLKLEIGENKDCLSADPYEQLLGSMSCSDTDGVEGKTRTSARVFKKMRYDSALQEKKVEKKEESKIEETKSESKKCLNPLWNSEEKKIFFEALNEFGKDFESIHSYLSSRLKKKGFTEEYIKSKHQVRHFYYKTFHFITNYVKFSDKVPKNAQELYSLVNYGEIRRKLGSVNKKACMRLSDLTYYGSIPLKLKGKTVRVKTPMCKALRRLNKLDEKYDDLKLPTRVVVELRPQNMAAFLRVQSIAQNPRIRMVVSLQKRLTTLIQYIMNRWKTTDALVYDKSIISTNVITKDCVPDQKEIETSRRYLNPCVRLRPTVDAKIDLPLIDISEYFTGQSICLSAYETRLGVKNAVKKEECVDIKVEPNLVDNSVNSDNQKNDSVFKINFIKNENAQHHNNHSKLNNEAIEERRARIEKIREGWSLETSGGVTVGEIYLMFGNDSKVVLEYGWDDQYQIKEEEHVTLNDCFSKETSPNGLTRSLKKLLSLAKLQSTKLTGENKCNCGNKTFKKPITTPKLKRTIQKTDYEQENAVDSSLVQSNFEKYSNDKFLQSKSNQIMQLFSQLNSVQRKNSIFRTKRGGRFRSKQLVVERNLVPNNNNETHHQIVTMNIVSQEKSIDESDEEVEQITNSGLNRGESSSQMIRNNDRSIGGLLSGASSPLSCGLSKILKENENQWIMSEVNDYSLSSLLGNLEGSSKTHQSSTCAIEENSQLPHDVDSQLKKLLMESSVDFAASFADLAAQVVDNKK